MALHSCFGSVAPADNERATLFLYVSTGNDVQAVVAFVWYNKVLSPYWRMSLFFVLLENVFVFVLWLHSPKET